MSLLWETEPRWNAPFAHRFGHSHRSVDKSIYLSPFLLVATSDSPHSLTHSLTPSFQFFVTLSIPMQIPIITFFTASLPPTFVPSRSCFHNLFRLAANPISFFSLLENWLCRKKGGRKRRLCFAGKLQRNNIRNQLCEGGTKSTRRERGRGESTDCLSIN